MSRGSSLGRTRRALAVAAALFVFAQVVPGAAQTTQEKLRAADRKARILLRELKQARAHREAVQAEIEGLIRQIEQARLQLEQLESEIDQTNRRIGRQNQEIEELQARLNERARAAYITGPGGMLEAILGAESLTEMSDRLTFLSVLSRQDSNVTVAIDLERVQLQEFEGALGGYATDQESLLKVLARQNRELDAKFDQALAAEDRVQDKYLEAKKAVEALRAERRRELRAALGNVGPPPSADGPFYWCPVDPPRSYIDDFGFPRVNHTHQGNDVFAPSGTPIRAPFDGVAEEGSGGLAGNYVRVHADANADYVFNAHLSRFAGVNGRHVTAGTTVGYVGNTGNAATTPSHDHFEYHPGGGSAVSPYVYLNEVCGVGGRGF